MDPINPPAAIVQCEEAELVALAISATNNSDEQSWLAADTYAELSRRGWKQKDIAAKVKRSQPHVSYCIACSNGYNPGYNRPSFHEAYREIKSGTAETESPKEDAPKPVTTKPAQESNSEAVILCTRCRKRGKEDNCNACKNLQAGRAANDDGAEPVTTEDAPREPGDDTESEEADKVQDHLGKAVPVLLRPAFDQVAAYRSGMAAVAKARSAIEIIKNTEASRELESQETDRLLHQAHANLRFAMPYTECVKCRRQVSPKCKHCKGTGWLNETTFKACASEQDKAWLEDRK